MIKFFRRIRQQLLTENKFSKYLIYAIGEIILVVIGILIALAINNANQRSSTKEKEQIYLAGLKNEFETSRLKLMQLIEVNRQNYEGAKEIMGHMFMDTVSITEVQFSKLLFGSFASDIAFNPNNSLLNEMINSGSLKDISNTELRKQLTNWISTLEDIARQENELGVHREKVVDIIRINENSIRTIMDLSGVSQELGLPMANVKMSNLKLLESTEFENNMLIFILTSYSTEKNHYNPLMHHLNFILQLIDAEIK